MRENSTPSFRTLKNEINLTSIGIHGEVTYATWHLLTKEPHAEITRFCCKQSKELSSEWAAGIRKQCFHAAVCASCSQPMHQFLFDTWLWEGVRYKFLACSCGHPLWIFGRLATWNLGDYVRERRRLADRQAKLRNSKWKHTKADITDILAIQSNRCPYCNLAFTGDNRPTKDHIMPLIHDGTNSALNIVMSCISCNSRRESIPFRTYCRLLNPRQNSRILDILRQRIRIAFQGQYSSRELLEFTKAYNFQDRYHHRALQIMHDFPSARRNFKSNSLLPTFHVVAKELIRDIKKGYA